LIELKKKIEKSEEEWRRKLSPNVFHILREKGTERAFTGKLLTNKKRGKYVCAGCGNELFDSDAKFDSGTGWPSFNAPESDESVENKSDNSRGMRRVEVTCSVCGGHLGHVFDDGPFPTGKRYCINSVALEFQESESSD